MSRLQTFLDMHNITLEDSNIIRNDNFSKLMEGIKTYEPSVVTLKEFTDNGRTLRYFWYKHDDEFGYNKNVAKPSSRSQMFGNREEFNIEPWNQIMVDKSNEYGTMVDNAIEDFYEKGLQENTLEEVIMSIHNMKLQRLVWVGRSVMICHPQGYGYGEVDEILYSPELDVYFVGDTKTSSSVVKGGYTYQLAMYIEILRLLNPDKKFAPLGIINWVKVKKTGWQFSQSFNENDWAGAVAPATDWAGKPIWKDHPIYHARCSEKTVPTEYIQSIIGIDVDALQMTNLVRAEWHLLYNLLPKHNYFAHASTLPQAIEENEEIREFNARLQERYEQIKAIIEPKWERGRPKPAPCPHAYVSSPDAPLIVDLVGALHEK